MVLRYLDTAIGFAVIMLLLSLLVTTLVQSVIAVLNLRGWNLKWGLELLLGQIDSGMTQEIREDISDKVLMHSAIASTGFLRLRRWAVAIRVEELFRILRQLGAGEVDKKGKLGPDALARLQQLLGEPLLAAARVEQLATDIAKVVPVDAAVLKVKMLQVLAEPGKVVAGVSDWFDTVMDRATQRFTMHTRWLSVIAAVLLTFALRLDTPGVLNRIWSNAALRDQLVAAAPAALRMADTVGSYAAQQKSLATRAIRKVRETQGDTALKTILGKAPPELGTLKEGEEWLARAVKGRADSATVVAAYRQQMGVQTDSLLKRYAQASDSVRGVLGDPAIGIFQSPLPSIWRYWWDGGHVVRGLVSIVLLSLGAPFWYNALKQMANLRPLLAKKVEEETKAKGG
jgi:hypothetical protein